VRCDFASSLLQGYYDGELNAPSAAELERHLQHCLPCATELVDLDLLSDRLQLAQLYEPATPSLRRKLKAHLRTIAPTTAASQPLLWHWLAAAAALLLVAIVLWSVTPGLGSDAYQTELAGEIVDAHVRSLQPGHMNDVASNDERVVKGWLDRGAGFVAPVRDFANEGFVLKGGRLDVIEGRGVAVLVYERNGRPINVFIWRTREPDTPPRAGALKGFEWIDCQKRKMEFCAVSDADPVDLEQFLQLVNSSAQA
jgi:anti-sigma factor RsiW